MPPRRACPLELAQHNSVPKFRFMAWSIVTAYRPGRIADPSGRPARSSDLSQLSLRRIRGARRGLARFAGRVRKPAAYGNIVAAGLALLAPATLPTKAGTPSCLGLKRLGQRGSPPRLLSGYASGLQPGLPGAAYFIPTFIVPLLFIT